MKRFPLYLLLTLPFCAFSELNEDQTPPAITVYTQFEHPYSTISIDTMREELRAIMSPLGLDFTWRDLSRSHGNEVSVELVVVTFKGTCEMDDGRTARGKQELSGWTHMSDGAILPFSDVDCDKIRRFISPEVRSMDRKDRDLTYGRAIGRVLAHELYHIFTNTTRHASWGVAKAFYTSKELASVQFQFQEKDTNALRTGKLGRYCATVALRCWDSPGRNSKANQRSEFFLFRLTAAQMIRDRVIVKYSALLTYIQQTYTGQLNDHYFFKTSQPARPARRNPKPGP